MRRKLFGCALGLMGGITCCYLSRPLTLSIVLLAKLWFAIESRSHLRRDRFAAAVIVSFLCGAILFYGDTLKIAYGQRYDTGQSAALSVTVLQVERIEMEKYRMVARLDRVNGNPVPPWASQKVLLSYYKSMKDPWGLCGRGISLSTVLSAPPAPGNPRCFNYSLYLRSRGISHVATAGGFTVCKGRPPLRWTMTAMILRGRDRFLSSLHCGDQSRALLSGILFGETQGLEEETYETFRNNGTAHVLAVSGLHIGILFGLWQRLFGKRKSRRALVLLVLLLGFYGTITLWSVSVTRAILLILLVMVGDMTDRRYDLLTALAVVALVVILQQPCVIFGAAFQMSFLAVCSMAFFSPFLLRKLPLWVPRSAAGILAIQMGMIPYTAYVFNYVPLAAILCNLPVVYMLTVIVPVGLAALAWSLLFDTAGPAGALLVDLSTMLRDVNEVLAMNGRFTADVQSPPFWILFLVYGIMFFVASEEAVVLKERNQKETLRHWVSLLLLGTVLLFPFSNSPMDKATFVFVDVGQGDCLHIRAAPSVDLLIDGGGKEDYNVGKKILKPYLLKNGASDVDLAMTTHLHTDHYKGLKELCACYPVRRLMISGKAGDVVHVSDRCQIELLWPKERDPATDDENVNSLIFRVEVDGYSVLVTGDLTEEGEKAMLEHYRGTDKLDCDILKVAHHGSKYSSTSEFLAAASPQIAVISVGRNTYGHPTPEAIRRLKVCGAKVFRTDQMGAVGIMTGKMGLSVVTGRGGCDGE